MDAIHHLFGAFVGLWVAYLIRNRDFKYAIAVLICVTPTAIALAVAFESGLHSESIFKKMVVGYQIPVISGWCGSGAICACEKFFPKFFLTTTNPTPRSTLFYFPCIVISWIFAFPIADLLIKLFTSIK